MNNPDVIPRKLEKETNPAYAAFCDYCQMGDSRSLRKLGDDYRQRKANDPAAGIPTQRERTIARWSTEHNWQKRASEYDQAVRQVKQEAINAEALEGLALPIHRIAELKKLASDLSRMIFLADDDHDPSHPGHRPFLFLRDKKVIGGGSSAYTVDVYRYNTSIVGDLRGALDDLAKETGGRRQQIDINDRGPVDAARDVLKELATDDLVKHYRDITEGRLE